MSKIFKQAFFIAVLCSSTALMGANPDAADPKQEGSVKEPLDLAILVSGNGSNMEEIVHRFEHPKKKGLVNIRVVISNKREAYALKRAQRAVPTSFKNPVPTEYVPSFKRDKPGEYSERLIACLLEHGITPGSGLVCLAGFMKMLDEAFVNHFKDRIINLHPSLIPSFTGGQAIKDALEYGVKQTGCTVHFVDKGMDTGAIIAQRTVAIADNDTEETLAQKIHEAEHEIYPQVIEWFAQGRIKKEGRKVSILPAPNE